MGSIWGFGDKTDGTVIDYIQFAEQSVGGYFVNDIAEVKDQQDSLFYEGMFGGMSEGGFVAKQEAVSRLNFGLDMLNVSLEGEFTVCFTFIFISPGRPVENKFSFITTTWPR